MVEHVEAARQRILKVKDQICFSQIFASKHLKPLECLQRSTDLRPLSEVGD